MNGQVHLLISLGLDGSDVAGFGIACIVFALNEIDGALDCPVEHEGVHYELEIRKFLELGQHIPVQVHD